MHRVAIVGDFDPEKAAHLAIPKAIQLASNELGFQFEHEWIATPMLNTNADLKLKSYQAVWLAPGSPYVSMQGALNSVQYARQSKVPFLGTYGGFQHMMIEYARNVLGLSEADHGETNPTASLILVVPLTCSVSRQNHTFKLTAGSAVAAVYGKTEIVEQYGICNYGLNPDFISKFEQAGMCMAGVDTNGEPRIMELNHHPFFVGTLFQPERSAYQNIVHPLIKALLERAIQLNTEQDSSYHKNQEA